MLGMKESISVVLKSIFAEKIAIIKIIPDLGAMEDALKKQAI
jgi:hypothetical protein